MTDYIVAVLVGVALCLLFMALLLPILLKAKAGQQILGYVKEHSSKQGTPTMGGIAFIAAFTIGSIFLLDEHSRLSIMLLSITVGYAIIGFLDDFIKIKFKRNLGLTSIQKIVTQLVIAVIAAIFVYSDVMLGSDVWIPFTNLDVSLGVWIIPLVIVVFIACTNGVNLTDGLDGLAGSVTFVYLVGLIALLILRQDLFNINGNSLFVMQQHNIIIQCFLMCGCLLGFLWFNMFPAKVFMGDVGSLALGGFVACASIFTKLSLAIPLLGIAYVVSCLSVILQVMYFKFTKGKRIFLMAPYHHHLQLKGHSEVRIAFSYCLVTFIVGVILVVISANMILS